MKNHAANAKPPPIILGVGCGAGHDQVGPEAIHRQRGIEDTEHERCAEPAVEIRERFLRDHEKGKGVGEAHFVGVESDGGE